jgi:hypothetical protein
MGELKASRSPSEPLQPWQLFTLAGLVGATIVVLVSSGQTPAGVVLLSLIVFAAAAVGVAALRTFLPLAGSATLDMPQVLGGRTRAALERDKALVLRSIKELEFDRAMGKLSPKDFEEMAGRLRSRAVALMKQLDEGGTPYRDLVERELAARLASDVARAPVAPDEDGRTVAETRCTCGTANDADASFCKRCGTRL